MVRAIYTDRPFYVQEDGRTSQEKKQSFGISQGCPLSPFLFVIMMTILMQDASVKMEAEFGVTHVPYLVARALLYADDTLLMEGDEKALQAYMDAVAAAGSEYGLSFK